MALICGKLWQPSLTGFLFLSIMLSESYINGLEQGKFDRQMLELEKQKYKEVLDEIKKICNSVPPTWSICGTDIIAKIEDVLREVE